MIFPRVSLASDTILAQTTGWLFSLRLISPLFCSNKLKKPEKTPRSFSMSCSEIIWHPDQSDSTLGVTGCPPLPQS